MASASPPFSGMALSCSTCVLGRCVSWPARTTRGTHSLTHTQRRGCRQSPTVRARQQPLLAGTALYSLPPRLAATRGKISASQCRAMVVRRGNTCRWSTQARARTRRLLRQAQRAQLCYSKVALQLPRPQTQSQAITSIYFMHPFVHENLKRYFFYNYFFYNDMEFLVRIESNRDYNFPPAAVPHRRQQQQVWLYHRLEMSLEVPGCGSHTNPARCLRLLTSEDGGTHWLEHRENGCVSSTPPISSGTTLLHVASAHPDSDCLIDTAEPLDAKIVDGRLLLLVDQPDRVFISQPLEQMPNARLGLFQAPTTLDAASSLTMPSCVAKARLGLLSLIPTDNLG